ncbi:MAG: HAD-IA family hydrolase [Bacteroidetes bacterium]|nr:HAD-IA family hydrolase [Bacteroidota bacterium]
MIKSFPIKHIAFDLDGTIVDSYQTIYKTTIKSLEELKINTPVDKDEFYKRIGQHFIDIFRDLNIPVKDFEQFISIYKDYYFDFIGDSKIYSGAIETLQFLIDKNIRVSLLTTKLQSQADKIIDHFNLRKYFLFVMGRRNGIANKPSAEPLLFICNELGIQPENTLMVGDTELDIQCGKNAGTKTCGAAYGYRTKEQLKKEGADLIILKITDLKNLLDL